MRGVPLANVWGQEITAELKPLMPKWQMFLALLVVVLLITGAFPPAFDPNTVAFFALLFVAIAAVMTYLLRNKTLRVRLSKGEGCILLLDESGPDPGKLVPSSIKRKTDTMIKVERKGTKWEIKRIELRFANSADTTKALLMLEPLLQ
jgi:hypothetical protein